MLSRQYVRAEYDEDRNAYVSTEANWIEGGPSLIYHFVLLENEESAHHWQGGLEKLWCDAEGNWEGEFFAFAEYAHASAFDADVEEILREARQVSVTENIDELLAVTDIVKQRAVVLGYEDDDIEELEGLFEDGPEDAYTLRDIGDDPRLHHHVACEDECWYFHVAPVVDLDGLPLGWGLFAVHLPDMPPNAPAAEIKGAKRARILLLDHLHSQREAKLAQHGFAHFMETERNDDPEYAYSDDTEVLEWAAINPEWNDKINAVVWQEYNGKVLQDFLSGSVPYAIPRAKWQPQDKALVDRFFEEHPQPIWLEDQLRAALDDQVGVEPDEDEDSPWQSLDLE